MCEVDVIADVLCQTHVGGSWMERLELLSACGGSSGGVSAVQQIGQWSSLWWCWLRLWWWIFRCGSIDRAMRRLTVVPLSQFGTRRWEIRGWWIAAARGGAWISVQEIPLALGSVWRLRRRIFHRGSIDWVMIYLLAVLVSWFDAWKVEFRGS